MDKAEEIFKKRKRADDFLVTDSNFVKTSEHPSWQGKIRCRYCKSTGYPGDVVSNNLWWGQKHGYNCKWKELWMVKNQSYQNTITVSTNTNWSGNWYVGSTGNAFFRGRI